MIQKNGQLIRSQPLESGESVLGRGEGCVIRLEDRAVSRQHAILRSSNGGITIERKSPVAPLLINGAECTTATLKEGDEIHVGPYVLKVSISAPLAAAQAEDPPAENPVLPEPVFEAPPVQEEVPRLELGTRSGPHEVEEINVESITQMHETAGEDSRTKVLATGVVKLGLRFASGVASVETAEFDQDEVSIGRGKGCDVVLNEKKASRKHVVIRRSGEGAMVSFTIVDLQSANGTFVNGARITEHVLSGDDLVRIGDVEFICQSVSPGFERRSRHFLKVDQAEPLHESASPDEGLFAPPFDARGAAPAAAMPAIDSGHASGFSNVAGIAGISVGGAPSGGSLLDRFRALPQRTRMLAIVAAGLAVFMFVGEDDAPKPKGAKAKKEVAARAAPNPAASGGPGGAPLLPTFEQLKPELKKFVESQYDLATQYFKNKDYDRALYEVRKIFQYVSDYADARDLERWATKGKQLMQAQEEEERRREAERATRTKVAQLVMEIGGHMSRREYEQARELFAQVIALDPENDQVVQWKKEIEKHDEQVREEAMRRKFDEETNARAREIVATADQKRAAGKWIDSIAEYDSALKLEPKDKKIVARANAGIEAAREGLKAAISPLITEGRELETQSEFSKAFQSYEKARAIDPRSSEALEGMARIRGVLGEQAKNLYTEAVLAESYSDFAQAKAKFEQIVQGTPKDDPYYERARRKLMKYVVREQPKLE